MFESFRRKTPRGDANQDPDAPLLPATVVTVMMVAVCVVTLVLAWSAHHYGKPAPTAAVAAPASPAKEAPAPAVAPAETPAPAAAAPGR